LELEDSIVIDTNALKATITIEEAMVKNTDLGFFLGHKLSVEPDFQLL